MSFTKHLLNFWRCIGKPHVWKYSADTLAGIWLECERCYGIDEFLPGLHEPKGGEAVWQQKLQEGLDEARN
jgi:hypothetical protein